MNIHCINDQTAWTDFFNDCGSPSFLQSWEWGELNKKEGHDILRLGVFDMGTQIAAAQVIKIKAKRGSMLFVPHGPIQQNSKFKIPFDNAQGKQNSKQIKIVKVLRDYLVGVARKENYSFIRISPILTDSPEGRQLFRDLGFRISPIYMHAERVWQLDLSKSEEKLLKDMRKTTRYSIRKAEKEGVVIQQYPIDNKQYSIINNQYAIYNKQVVEDKEKLFNHILGSI